MAYDEGLAERVRAVFQARTDVEEKRMFGGLCFMVSHHMCCGIVNETLMCRVGPANYQTCLAEPHASEMDFTGRPLTGMIYVSAPGVDEDSELQRWLDTCIRFIDTLPPKKLG